MSEGTIIQAVFYAASAIILLMLARRDKIRFTGTVLLQILFVLTALIYRAVFAENPADGLIAGLFVGIALSTYLTVQYYRGKPPAMYLPDVLALVAIWTMLGVAVGCVFYILFVLALIGHGFWLAKRRQRSFRKATKRQPMFPPMAIAYVACLPLGFIPFSLTELIK